MKLIWHYALNEPVLHRRTPTTIPHPLRSMSCKRILSLYKESSDLCQPFSKVLLVPDRNILFEGLSTKGRAFISRNHFDRVWKDTIRITTSFVNIRLSRSIDWKKEGIKEKTSGPPLPWATVRRSKCIYFCQKNIGSIYWCWRIYK